MTYRTLFTLHHCGSTIRIQDHPNMPYTIWIGIDINDSIVWYRFDFIDNCVRWESNRAFKSLTPKIRDQIDRFFKLKAFW